jgi:nucleoid DNA-binding protein
MKKQDIANRLARRSGVTRAEAADQLDRVVHRILTNLKRGQSAPLPGLGTFTVKPDGGIEFESEEKGGRHAGE